MITDCLVIGGGLTARRCAEVLARRFDVTLVADGAGASPYIHGVCVPLDPADSLDAFIEDTLRSGKYQNDPALVRVLCEGALSLADELPFDRTEEGYALLRPLGASYPRVAGIQSRTGPYVLQKINESKAFRELRSTRAMRLRVEDGRVLGAEVFHTDTRTWEYIGARAVVLASGGFGGIYPFSTNSADIGGDGVAMGYLAGARLVDLEFVQFEPTVALSPSALRGRSVITTMLFEGACFKNTRGECFMTSDRVDKDILSKQIAREVLRGGGTELGGVYFDATGVPVSVLDGKYQTYRQRYLNHGIDIAKEPMEVAPGAHTTLGGIVIDTACRTDVTGLFAAGEVTGGLHGANRLGGNAGLETLVFGRLAGESVARYLEGAPEAVDIAIDPVDTPYDGEALHTEVKTLLGDALGVIREAGKMRHAMARLSEILEAVEGDTHSFSRMRLYNDALTAHLAIGAALLREGSIGAHERSDAKGETVRYRILCDKAHGFQKENLNIKET